MQKPICYVPVLAAGPLRCPTIDVVESKLQYLIATGYLAGAAAVATFTLLQWRARASQQSFNTISGLLILQGVSAFSISVADNLSAHADANGGHYARLMSLTGASLFPLGCFLSALVLMSKQFYNRGGEKRPGWPTVFLIILCAMAFFLNMVASLMSVQYNYVDRNPSPDASAPTVDRFDPTMILISFDVELALLIFTYVLSGYMCISDSHPTARMDASPRVVEAARVKHSFIMAALILFITQASVEAVQAQIGIIISAIGLIGMAGYVSLCCSQVLALRMSGQHMAQRRSWAEALITSDHQAWSQTHSSSPDLRPASRSHRSSSSYLAELLKHGRTESTQTHPSGILSKCSGTMHSGSDRGSHHGPDFNNKTQGHSKPSESGYLLTPASRFSAETTCVLNEHQKPAPISPLVHKISRPVEVLSSSVFSHPTPQPRPCPRTHKKQDPSMSSIVDSQIRVFDPPGTACSFGSITRFAAFGGLQSSAFAYSEAGERVSSMQSRLDSPRRPDTSGSILPMTRGYTADRPGTAHTFGRHFALGQRPTSAQTIDSDYSAESFMTIRAGGEMPSLPPPAYTQESRPDSLTTSPFLAAQRPATTSRTTCEPPRSDPDQRPHTASSVPSRDILRYDRTRRPRLAPPTEPLPRPPSPSGNDVPSICHSTNDTTTDRVSWPDPPPRSDRASLLSFPLSNSSTPDLAPRPQTRG